MADSFRMDMSGEKSFREDALDAAMDVFGENTRSNAVVKACEHARRDKWAKEDALEFLAKNVEPEIVQEFVSRLATPQLPVAVEITCSNALEGTSVDVAVGSPD